MIIFGGLLSTAAKILINILLIEFLIFVFKNCREVLKDIIKNGFERLSEFLKRRRES